MNINKLFIIFIIYSFIGWVIEVIYTFIMDKHFVNRGFLIGPYCPIYGLGCIFVINLLGKYKNDIVVVFVMSIMICSLIEYFTSLILEKIFNARWWDYSRKKFNLNGRICLETMLPFGVLCCIVIYILNPFILKILSYLSFNLLNILFVFLLTIITLDLTISLLIIIKLNFKAGKIRIDNQEEITKKVKDYIYNYSWIGKRLIKSFPHMKVFKNDKK